MYLGYLDIDAYWFHWLYEYLYLVDTRLSLNFSFPLPWNLQLVLSKVFSFLSCDLVQYTDPSLGSLEETLINN